MSRPLTAFQGSKGFSKVLTNSSLGISSISSLIVEISSLFTNNSDAYAKDIEKYKLLLIQIVLHTWKSVRTIDTLWFVFGVALLVKALTTDSEMELFFKGCQTWSEKYPKALQFYLIFYLSWLITIFIGWDFVSNC